MTLPASGQGSVRRTGPAQTPEHPTRSPLPLSLITAGALVIAATYIAVILTQPAHLDVELGPADLWTMAGYLLGGILIAAGSLSYIPRSIIGLMPVAIALNIAVGQIVGVYTPIPLYLDSIGTVMIGVLAGPAAGALTGILTNILWGVTINPGVIAFSTGAAFIGAAAGWAARLGLFRRIWTAVLAGAVAGVPAAALGAPVAAYIYGGGVGSSTAGVVAILQAAGMEMLHATLAQSLVSDIADKALIFALAFAVVHGLPRRITDRYPFTRFTRRPRRSE